MWHMHPCPAPTSGWQAQVSVGAYSVCVCVCVCVCFLLVMLPSEIQKLPTYTPVSEFPTVWKLPLLHDSLPRAGLCPEIFCHCFCLSYFVLPPFEYIGLHLWVSGVLCQHSEVVLWKLLRIQMICWWICWGESGLPILFLHYLGTASWALSF